MTEVKYCIFDPNKNITALVETDVPAEKQPETAAQIMKKHPEVEQAGFVKPCVSDEADTELRMAGGEFCGNATMCAAALYMIRNDMNGKAEIKVKVSGTADPLTVSLVRKDENSFDTSVIMPPAISIEDIGLNIEGRGGDPLSKVPLVRMGGIDHVIIRDTSFLFNLKDQKELAETLLRRWCGVLGSDCMGMMFLEEKGRGVGSKYTMTPLVYVPGADTVFWENSCASGSAAAGMYLAAGSGRKTEVTLYQQGGVFKVTGDPESGAATLCGSVILL